MSRSPNSWSESRPGEPPAGSAPAPDTVSKVGGLPRCVDCALRLGEHILDSTLHELGSTASWHAGRGAHPSWMLRLPLLHLLSQHSCGGCFNTPTSALTGLFSPPLLVASLLWWRAERLREATGCSLAPALACFPFMILLVWNGIFFSFSISCRT